MLKRRSCCPALAKLALLVLTQMLVVVLMLHDLHAGMLLLDYTVFVMGYGVFGTVLGLGSCFSQPNVVSFNFHSGSV